ncbi:organic solute transporter ostalpha domain-containing protein [Hirsutella rhossiliensis]|uniref:Organic solute transporter ostalpha domain-containing protein n=1 Tax=Hirsutella rhossiliensis TaxID=111463 RepID=A0A9P8N209_9HYPO|nr:organic solute transporter ostalpha domain-containing protein [Hirsutella rhossiliensis]KAH0965477.1 organic solute transporter ostalpha domain-containing protein [Hirsutella rhossiliensis]
MPDGGTGKKFTYATTVVAGVASLAATLLSVVSIWLQAKNYRKPLLQRYVIRILLMVPIYSIASWTSMVSLTTAAFLDPIRDIYEAFTIYTFFQLLINYLHGERSLIIMTHGRAPVQHLWPLNYVLRNVDISDPHTFLSIKRGILQYAWLKPILALAAIVMKATGTYQEGYIGPGSGYLWSGILYNISVTLSLYSLGLFWVCMHKDLQPFRPVPKFLCIKLVIFASYWQGFFLSILVWLGAIPDDVEGYTRDNLAAAIQDALICIEMPIFAVAHWYAFSWHDFANNDISSARMPLNYALRDAFGVRDLIEDSRETFKGNTYGYRAFDSGDKVMAHEDSKSRLARLREGMRYERGGKGKYWIPKPGEINAASPLLGSNGEPSSSRPDLINDNTHGTFEEPEIDDDDERLYSSARQLEFGDWNYPVITASEPLSERYRSSQASLRAGSPGWAPTASPSPAPLPVSPPPHSERSRSTEEPQQVVPIKKKRTKKIVKHAQPNTSDLGLGRGPPAPQSAEQGRSADPRTEEARPQVDVEAQQQEDRGPQIHVPDSDEFRNVWDGDR